MTKEYLKNRTIMESNPSLQVIGDISCDIDGSIEITRKATKPDDAYYTYFAEDDRFEDGVAAAGRDGHGRGQPALRIPPRIVDRVFRGAARFRSAPSPPPISAGQRRSLKLPYPIQKALILHQRQFQPRLSVHE